MGPIRPKIKLVCIPVLEKILHSIVPFDKTENDKLSFKVCEYICFCVNIHSYRDIIAP